MSRIREKLCKKMVQRIKFSIADEMEFSMELTIDYSIRLEFDGEMKKDESRAARIRSAAF